MPPPPTRQRPISLALALASVMFLSEACSSSFNTQGGRIPKSRETTPDSEDKREDTSDTAMDELTPDSAPGVDDPSAWLFSLEQVYDVDLTLSEASVASLQADPWTTVPGDMLFDGHRFPNVGVRLKGRVGSFRDLGQKSGFKVDINAFEPGRDFYGLERLTFSNMVQDPSFVHEPAAYAVFGAMGLSVPRIGYVWLRVNGLDFGLYENVETYDKTFLERRYTNPEGNLYDGDYYLWPDWSYSLIDFNTSSQDLFALDEGRDNGRADIHAITEAIAASAGSEDYTRRVGELVDWEKFFAHWAAENWVAQYDGYSYNSNNYRLYFDPTDGRAELLSWDHDWSFCSTTPLTTPIGLLSANCLRQPSCQTSFMAEVQRVALLFDPGTVNNKALVADTNLRITLLWNYIEADPRKEVSADTARASQQELLSWFASRSTTLRGTWGL